ncbi:Fic family protein [Gilvimarinus chinensis]|uniref:Fic family protein n=1 Tax=Gilvimarinus chinensis TaxID=396005 RepID=UPI0003A032E6|nr:Fic family protein [Gilvimarinus chinensis]
MNSYTYTTWLKAMQKGLTAYAEHRFKTAYNYFSQAVKIASDNPESWINLAETANQLHQYQKAINFAKTAQAINPRLPQTYQIIGDALLESGRYREALSYFQSALKLTVNAGTLYRLARCMILLSRDEQAEQLLSRALSLDPYLTPASILLATTKLKTGKADEALASLDAIKNRQIPEKAASECQMMKSLIIEYQRCQPIVDKFLANPSTESLSPLVRKNHADNTDKDHSTLSRLRKYASALQSSKIELKPLEKPPEQWPEYEAFFMIPLTETATQFLSIRDEVILNREQKLESLETKNMINAITHAQSKRNPCNCGQEAQVTLREVHALASTGLPRLHPGQYKFSQNGTVASKVIERTPPIKVNATLHAFYNEIYPSVESGFVKSILVLMAIADIHPFTDGNGRVAITMFNRELESAGLQPVVFTKKLGIKGALTSAMNNFRLNPNSSPNALIEVIKESQITAINFISELTTLRNSEKTYP